MKLKQGALADNPLVENRGNPIPLAHIVWRNRLVDHGIYGGKIIIICEINVLDFIKVDAKNPNENRMIVVTWKGSFFSYLLIKEQTRDSYQRNCSTIDWSSVAGTPRTSVQVFHEGCAWLFPDTLLAMVLGPSRWAYRLGWTLSSVNQVEERSYTFVNVKSW